MIKKILFNLSHWCLNYKDYEMASEDIANKERTQIEKKISERGYMEKSDLRTYYWHPLNSHISKQEIRTSGSTGTPIRFWCDAGRIASSLALVDYRFKQLGFDKDSIFMKLWYPTTGHTFFQMLKEKLYRLFNKEKFFSYFDLVNKKKTIDDFIEFVNENKPDFIEGYAGGLIAISSYAKNKGIKIPKVKVIVTGAGMVSSEQHRLIEEVFNCKHYDRYGCSEFGEIAHQLGGEHYEQNPFLTIEVSKDFKEFKMLKDSEDGEYEIFITDPRNKCTKFWRYRMHDIVKVKNHKIVQILGRTEKMYDIGNGEFLPTGFFYQAMKDFIEIDQWQVEIDTKTRNLILRTMPRALNSKESESFINYFGQNKFNFSFEIGDFETVGRREKIDEIIIK